ncbi:MAG: hypothetical protein ACLFRM_05840 [Guyparkeria sp.]|uniref:hypothetical protein n=1 Tax=Guyparkeria sp. TaxID=2035736 RepID=UPI00397ABCCF
MAVANRTTTGHSAPPMCMKSRAGLDSDGTASRKLLFFIRSTTDPAIGIIPADRIVVTRKESGRAHPDTVNNLNQMGD